MPTPIRTSPASFHSSLAYKLCTAWIISFPVQSIYKARTEQGETGTAPTPHNTLVWSIWLVSFYGVNGLLIMSKLDATRINIFKKYSINTNNSSKSSLQIISTPLSFDTTQIKPDWSSFSLSLSLSLPIQKIHFWLAYKNQASLWNECSSHHGKNWEHWLFLWDHISKIFPNLYDDNLH